MALRGAGSTVPRRQLGRQLRELREARQLTIQEVIDALDWSRPRIWRYETGQVPMQATDVEALCRLYQAGTEVTRALTTLARQSKADGWWQAYGHGTPEWFDLYVGMEAAASRLRVFEPTTIHGLLQSPGYMRSIIGMGLQEAHTPEVVEQRVSLRLQRQKILTRRSPAAPHLDVIFDISALLRGFTPEVMIDQLTRLATLANQPNIAIRVVPFEAGAHKGYLGPFAVLEFPRESLARDPEPTTVYQEGPTGALYLDKPEEVEVFEAIWANLADLALGQAESSRLIHAVTERWAR